MGEVFTHTRTLRQQRPKIICSNLKQAELYTMWHLSPPLVFIWQGHNQCLVVTISASWSMPLWWFIFAFLIQLTTLNSNSDVVVDNIPDQLATEIPRTLLLGLSNQNTVLQKVNKKRWRRQQVSGTQSNSQFVWTHSDVNESPRSVRLTLVFHCRLSFSSGWLPSKVQLQHWGALPSEF